MSKSVGKYMEIWERAQKFTQAQRKSAISDILIYFNDNNICIIGLTNSKKEMNHFLNPIGSSI